MGPSVTNNPPAAQAATTAPATAATSNPLAEQSFSGASTNVAGFRTNIAALATATALAVGTNDIARAQTNDTLSLQHGAPTTLVTPGANQIVYTSVQVPGQPVAQPMQVVNIKVATIAELKGLNRFYDARGRELAMEQSGTPREGDSISGSPSRGEVVRLIATGVQELKAKNGGVIPADEVVVVTIQGKYGATVLPINAELFPRPDRVSEKAFRVAERDPANRKAIVELSEPKGDLSVRITHEPGGVATIKYNQAVNFELKKKQ